MARMLDGQVSAVVGTHTHVQTADEQILPGGTAYLSDAGFTGPHESVLGREIEPVIRRFVTNMPQRFEVARDRILMQGVVVSVDEATGRATSITRVSESLSIVRPDLIGEIINGGPFGHAVAPVIGVRRNRTEHNHLADLMTREGSGFNAILGHEDSGRFIGLRRG